MSTAIAESNISSLHHFSPVGLDEIGEEFLMRRKEIKYFFHKTHFPALLQLLKEDFNVLEIDNRRVQKYQSIYLDTTARTLYLNHHNGHANRLKFRFREYVDSGSLFFEVKHRQNTGVTAKHRIALQNMNSEVSREEIDKLLASFSEIKLDGLDSEMTIAYDRIALVNKNLNARITLDQNVICHDAAGRHEFENLVILELKFNRKYDKYLLMKALRQMHLYPERISKYCVSTCKLHPEIKRNRFKLKLGRIDQIQNSITI